MSDSAAMLERSQRFRDARIAGRGATGQVFRAFDTELGIVVAIKVLADADPDRLLRLKREFRSLQGVSHPNLIQLFDLVVDGAHGYFTMEFVEGVDFQSHVAGPEGSTSEAVLARFLESAPQLVRGVRALHRAGHVHRDIKPSNLRVDEQGRVVLLDLDLSAAIDPAVGFETDNQFAGTMAYMAPEQLLGGPVAPAADWYATGVVLYEALSGELPVSNGSAHWVSERLGIVPLRARVPDLPIWLAELVEALLATDPGDRPDGDELLSAFEMKAVPRTAAERSSRQALQSPIGRAVEIARLGSAYDSAHSAVVVIRGPSGVGKTELVRGFLRDIDRRDAKKSRANGPIVLSGRCNPQESVAYQALDPLVDGLTRELMLADSPSLDLTEREATAVIALFPILLRIDPIARLRLPDDPIDVTETRRYAIQGLRKLLASVALDRRLIIWLDDVQWSDRDSAILLAELIRPRDSPRILLISACRSEEHERSALLTALDELAARVAQLDYETIDLAPLDPLSSAALAGRLAGTTPLRPDQLEAIVSEAGGSPFLIQEMVERVVSTSQDPRGAGAVIDLANALRDRLNDLGRDERRLLELVSLCGQPTERSLILEATGIGAAGLPLIARLQSRSLLRVQVESGQQALSAYHDRIRETIAKGLQGDRRRELHASLARVLDAQPIPEAERLAHHYHGAGDLSRAAEHAVAAARQAADAFAFAHAADLFRQAREWDQGCADSSRALITDEATCRASASFLTEAGRLFLEASNDAPPVESLDFRRRAVENLIAGGSVDEGTTVLRELVAELGLDFPASPRRALLGSLWKLLRLFSRGTEVSTRTNTDKIERVRIDTCFAAGKGLVDMDSFRGTYFAIAALERALSAGDRYRSARSLSVVGGLTSLFDPFRARGQAMMEQAHDLAAELDAPELLGTLAVAQGQVLMLSGRWAEARKKSSEGVRLLSEECQGYAFECNIGRGNVLRALEEIGEDSVEIADRARDLYDAAVAASNLYAETAAVQHLSFAEMARNDYEAARELSERGVSLWSRDGFHLQHLYTARAVALCDLYSGQPEPSRRRFQEIAGPLRRSGLMRVPLVWVDVHAIVAHLALATAARARPSERAALLRECGRHASQLSREQRPDAQAHAHLLRAGVETLRGREQDAIRQLGEATRVCEAGGMPLRAACAELRRGELTGGDSGRRSIERASARIRSAGVRAPKSWAAMYALGFDLEGVERPS